MTDDDQPDGFDISVRAVANFVAPPVAVIELKPTRLSLSPDSGNGMSWRLSLEIVGVDLEADVGERTFSGRPEWRHERYRQDERAEALQQARAVARALGLESEVEHDDSHWTWTR